MSAGSGYRYLLRSVVAGDADRARSTPLTRYYAEAGTPPGRWMGSGLSQLGAGQLQVGLGVTEEQLALLIGLGRDPITGEQLGRAFQVPSKLSERIAKRIQGLDPEMTVEDCAAETALIEADEALAGSRRGVAGFDLTFSVPKSVSVLWGLADAGTQERIVAAHHAAVADVLDYFEREVAATRTGVSDADGAVAQVGVAGVAAVAYDHYDSRAGDPQLHTHLVVSNKVRTLLDGRWRSLDGRPVFASVTGLSAHYNALLADRLTREVGADWELRQRGADRNPQWEIVGVSEDMVREFSSRSRDIDLAKEELIADYVTAHGRMPSAKTIVELRAQATVATRPPKEIRSLTDLTAEWRARAAARTGEAADWEARVVRREAVVLAADDVSAEAVAGIAGDVVAAVGEKRSTWTHWNLVAQAAKQTMDLRFATTQDRETIVAMVVEAAQHQSVALTPPELASSPVDFRRPDGSSVFRPRHSGRYTSTELLEAESHLLERSERAGGPVVWGDVVERVLASGGKRLSEQQRAAVRGIVTSGRRVDLLVGPAGAGKTTTMRLLRSVWAAEHGRESVIGLAPSATAAQALADDLEIVCDNTAKWLHDYEHGRAFARAGQLVIIDEATLADTRSLDRISEAASAVGAKVLLVGDPHQLQSVNAGGAFALLVDRRADVPELTDLHRFAADWEKAATLKLRAGDVEVISTYAHHDRILEGLTGQMLDAAYDAWRADTLSGRASILVTESAHAVRELNERARAERLIHDGAVDGREVALVDGTRAGVGDVVITRRNDRTLQTAGQGWVKNGDRWTITDLRRDGSVVVHRIRQRRSGSAVLPAEYVAEHLDLGYAVTAHRAQGVTVDTAHVVVTPSTTRENFYVSMTRGRDSNIAYVALDQPDDIHATPEPDGVSARSVLYGILKHCGVALSAHQTLQAEYELVGGIDRLAAEYETIAAAGQRDRMIALLRDAGLTSHQQAAVITSTGFGPLTAALCRAEAHHHNLDDILARAVNRRGLEDASDLAAVLRYRVQSATAGPPVGCRLRPRMVVGLIPEPAEPLAEEYQQALQERKELIESRARALVQDAQDRAALWLQQLGVAPQSAEAYGMWLEAATTVAAYRDRYKVTSDRALGPSAENHAQRMDRERAHQAARDAVRIANAVSGFGISASRPHAISSPQPPVAPTSPQL